MSTYTNPKVWSNGEALTATELNKLGTSLETFFNVTKLSGSNLKSATVSRTNLVDPSSYVEISFTAIQPNPVTLWPAIGNYDDYIADLDVVKVPVALTIKSMSAYAFVFGLPAGQKVKLYHIPAIGLPIAIDSSEITVPNSGAAKVDSINYTIPAGDSISLRMDDCLDTAKLPVRVSVWATVAHTS